MRVENLLSFSEALELLKNGGKRICRKGWNGKGMWLALVEEESINSNNLTKGIASKLEIDTATDGLCKFLAFIIMKTADGSFVPWLASQTDILSDDWEVVVE